MTISYAGEVPNGSSFGCFWKILWKWRGSVYKLVWRELVAYLCLYYTINLVYRFALNEQQQKIFTKLRVYFGQQSEGIPMSFVLGFYVSLVVNRWWQQYRLLPWPDTLALFISAAIPNSSGGINNETGRLMRRNIMRYMVLSYVITLQRISLRVKRRFPTTQHLVDAGLMHESEMKIFEALNQKSPMSKYWMPLVWATNVINRARKEGLIASDHIVQTILTELSDIRRRLGGLIGYDTVCVPLVYTQVVTLVLYTYFIAALLGRQMLPNMPDRNGKEDPDLYFPLFTVLQFVFYVGWLKVAEVLINPFGEDDDDIELNWLIDRHIKAAYMIVDEMHEEHPELLRDQYWECVVPKDLPYTVASEHYRKDEPKGSAENYKVKKEDAMYANIVPGGIKRIVTDDVYADYESVDTPMVERRKSNWLGRQLSRMSSMRSQSTAYSSGGMAYNRNRLNSVYINPETALPMTIIQQQQQLQQQQPQQLQVPQQHLMVSPTHLQVPQHHLPSQQQQQQQQQQMQQTTKPTFYEKFMQRKSLRTQRQWMKQNSRLNGLNVASSKARPRMPTPDVSKELINDQKPFNANTSLNGTTNSTNTILIPSAAAATPAPAPAPEPTSAPNPKQHQLSAKNPMVYPYNSTPTINNKSTATTTTTITSTTSTLNMNLNNNNNNCDTQIMGKLLLTPITEDNSSSSNNNTLNAGHPATNALAQAVLNTTANMHMKDGHFQITTGPSTATTNSINNNKTVALAYHFHAAGPSPSETLNILPLTATTTAALTMAPTLNDNLTITGPENTASDTTSDLLSTTVAYPIIDSTIQHPNNVDDTGSTTNFLNVVDQTQNNTIEGEFIAATANDTSSLIIKPLNDTNLNITSTIENSINTTTTTTMTTTSTTTPNDSSNRVMRNNSFNANLNINVDKDVPYKLERQSSTSLLSGKRNTYNNNNNKQNNQFISNATTNNIDTVANEKSAATVTAIVPAGKALIVMPHYKAMIKETNIMNNVMNINGKNHPINHLGASSSLGKNHHQNHSADTKTGEVYV